MYLIAGAGSIAFQTDTAIDIRTWLLGINTSFTNLEIPSNIQVGDYEVKLAIHDPDTDAPGVLFANTGRDSEDRYVVSNLRIE